MPEETLGQIAFDAYNKDRGGINHLGKRTPEWEELPQEIQHAWEAAAKAIVQVCIHKIGGSSARHEQG